MTRRRVLVDDAAAGDRRVEGLGPLACLEVGLGEEVEGIGFGVGDERRHGDLLRTSGDGQVDLAALGGRRARRRVLDEDGVGRLGARGVDRGDLRGQPHLLRGHLGLGERLADERRDRDLLDGRLARSRQQPEDEEPDNREDRQREQGGDPDPRARAARLLVVLVVRDAAAGRRRFGVALARRRVGARIRILAIRDAAGVGPRDAGGDGRGADRVDRIHGPACAHGYHATCGTSCGGCRTHAHR